jgi:hypothetical protein
VNSDVPFMPGLELSRAFYVEAVAPILATRFPGLVHSAGLLGTGSEVLGFDTPRSMDHWWGPRVALYLRSQDFTADLAERIRDVLANELPFEFRGFPTHMREVDRATGTVFMERTQQLPLNHLVYVETASRFLTSYLGVDPLNAPLAPADWLAIHEQHLRSVVSGGVWHDATGDLERARAILRWYPHDVWLYVMAAQWRRIEQEEAFPGRCVEVGDELGSRVVAARLVRELMHLAFMLEREYMPYSKWLGTAFSRLRCAADLTPSLLGALGAQDWSAREQHLNQACESVARLHNQLGITEPLPDRVSPFFGRPFLVIHAGRFAEALQAAICDEAVKALPRWLGNTTQWADSTDVLDDSRWARPLRSLYV